MCLTINLIYTFIMLEWLSMALDFHVLEKWSKMFVHFFSIYRIYLFAFCFHKRKYFWGDWVLCWKLMHPHDQSSYILKFSQCTIIWISNEWNEVMLCYLVNFMSHIYIWIFYYLLMVILVSIRQNTIRRIQHHPKTKKQLVYQV